jgi:hypothetical protein
LQHLGQVGGVACPARPPWRFCQNVVEGHAEPARVDHDHPAKAVFQPHIRPQVQQARRRGGVGPRCAQIAHQIVHRRDGRDGIKGEKGERGAEGRAGRDLTQMTADGRRY